MADDAFASGLDPSLDGSSGGFQVKYGHTDGGLWDGHPDFQSGIGGGRISFEPGSDTDDFSGHGTHTAGALVGDVFSFEATERDNQDGGPPEGGELVIAIDPGRCVGGDKRPGQLARAEALFARILEQEGTRLPSDRRYEARLRTPTEGISIPSSLYETLRELDDG